MWRRLPYTLWNHGEFSYFVSLDSHIVLEITLFSWENLENGEIFFGGTFHTTNLLSILIYTIPPCYKKRNIFRFITWGNVHSANE